MKQAKMAINARMILMAAGLFLIFNAVTSTSMEGLRWFNIVHLVNQYDEDVASGKIKPETEEEKKEETVAAEEPVEGATQEETTSGKNDEEASSTESTAEAETAATQEVDIPALKSEMETLGITLSDLRLLGIACYVMTVIRIIAGVVCVRFSNRVDRAGITLKTVSGLITAEVIYILLQFFKRALFLGSILYTAVICGALLWGALKMKKLAEEDPERIYAVDPAKRKIAEKPAVKQQSLHDKALMNTHAGSDAENVKDENTSIND